MPAAARLGDLAQVEADAHGCPACPHPGVGPIVTASTDVFVNGKGAARQDDLGIHAVCCGPNNFSISKGSATVYVNGKPLARMNDRTKHCGGTGPIIQGSPDVYIDDGAADAAAIAAYAVEAVKIALEKSAQPKKTEAKKGPDAIEAAQAKPPARDLSRDAADERSAGSIVSARWGVQRAANGQEVTLQIECSETKGQLQIEIWARSADRAQDQKVKTESAGAAKTVRKQVKLEIPASAAARNECHFYFVVRDERGGERRSDTLFVDRLPLKFSV